MISSDRLKAFIAIGIFLFAGVLNSNQVFAQETFEISYVPIQAEGDGLLGHAELRLRAACMGEPRLQVAVNRVVIDGIRYKGIVYRGNMIDGLSFPREVSGGLLYVRGYLHYAASGMQDGGVWDIKEKAIGVKLQGFLDWITIEEGQEPHEMTCPEWTEHVDELIAKVLQTSLVIYKEENLGDGLYYRLINMIDAAEAEAEQGQDQAVTEESSGTDKAAGDEKKSDVTDNVNSTDQMDTGDKNTGDRQTSEQKTEKQEETSVTEEESGTEEYENSSRQDNIDYEVKRMAEYNAAIQSARAAEARGDNDAALRAYRRAQSYNPTSEARDKIMYLEGANAAGELGRSLVDAFLGDPNKELREWEERSRRERAARNRKAEQLKNNLTDQKDFLGLLRHVLSGNKGEYPGRGAWDGRDPVIKQGDIYYSAGPQLRALSSLPENKRPQTLYVFGFNVRTFGTRNTSTINRALRNALPGQKDLVEPPGMEIVVSDIIEIPVNETTIENAEIVDRDILENIETDFFNHDKSNWNGIRIVAMPDLSYARELRSLITRNNAFGMEVTELALDYRFSDYELDRSMREASMGRRLIANAEKGVSVWLKNGPSIYFWNNRYLLVGPTIIRLPSDARKAFEEVTEKYSRPENGQIIYGLEIGDEYLAADRSNGFYEIDNDRIPAGSPYRYMPFMHANTRYMAISRGGISGSHKDLIGKRTTVCGPPENTSGYLMSYGTYEKGDSRLNLQNEGTVYALPCMEFTVGDSRNKRGRYILTYSIDSAPRNFTFFDDMEFEFRGKDSKGNRDVFETDKFRFRLYEVREPKFYWVSFDFNRERPSGGDLDEERLYNMDMNLRNRFKESGWIPDTINERDIQDGGEEVLPEIQFNMVIGPVTPRCFEKETDRCGQENFDKFAGHFFDRNNYIIFDREFGVGTLNTGKYSDFNAGKKAYDEGNFRLAKDYFQKSADEDYSKAQYYLGLLHYYGNGVSKDYKEAFTWFEKAAGQGHDDAQNYTGQMNLLGKGVEQDYKAASEWYKKAAEQGNMYAQHNLGYVHEMGFGVAKNYEKAIKWYRKAAGEGYASSQFNLGLAYQEGRGVARDHQAAMRWYEKAAEQGHANAKTNIAVMYINGEGVAPDDKKAFEWFKRAAEEGSVQGLHYLGLMYYNGRGVEKDVEQAKYWIRKAAEQGYEPAGKMLDKLNNISGQSKE